jgi:hypothetical protein
LFSAYFSRMGAASTTVLATSIPPGFRTRAISARPLSGSGQQCAPALLCAAAT